MGQINITRGIGIKWREYGKGKSPRNKKEIKEILSEITEIPEKDLKEDADFMKDLGIDSMMDLEITACIEKKYKIVIPEEEIPNLGSLRDVYEMVGRLLLSK